MTNKILTLLGFASKAGKLSYGFDASLTSLKKHKSNLILIPYDISKKSAKEINFFAEKVNVKCLILEGLNIENVSDAIGRKCGIISVNDPSFAKGCINAISEGENAND